MFAPGAFGSQGRAAGSDHLVGALVVTFAVIAMAEVARPLRFINILFGAWLIVAPWVLSGFRAGAKWNDIAVGLAVVLLSMPRGKVRAQYAAWNEYIV